MVASERSFPPSLFKEVLRLEFIGSWEKENDASAIFLCMFWVPQAVHSMLSINLN